MSCSRASDVDLAAFASDPQAAEWQEFRRHYPGCADCAAEVARWSRLAALLEEAAPEEVAMQGSAHPAPDELLRFGDAPAELSRDARSRIERHVEHCAPCRSELAVLRGFELDALAARTSPEHARSSPAPEQRGLLAAAQELFESLLGFSLPQPVLAGLVLALIALPGAWLLLGREGEGRPGDTQLAREEVTPTPARQELQEPTPPALELEAPPARIAEAHPQAPSTPEPLPELLPEPAAPAPESSLPAPARVAEVPESPEPSADPAPSATAIQIAALLPDALPQYDPNPALLGGSLESVRQTSLIRAQSGALPRISALAPPHVGASASAQPNLYWHLSEVSPAPVEIVLIESEAVEPLLELRLDAPVSAGLQRVDLAAHGIRLEAGATYEWSVTLVPDAALRDRDVISSAALRVAPTSAELSKQLEQAGAERAHLQAAAGYWYDAFETLSNWIANEPDAPRLRAHRNALLEQAELEPID